MKIAVGTKSELKIRALQEALKKLKIESEIVNFDVPSGIPSQPFGFEETFQGAKNRACQALEKSNADMSIGIENGIMPLTPFDTPEYFDSACVYVVTKDGKSSFSFSAGIYVPQWIIQEIKEKNTEFGYITQKLSSDTDKDPMKYFSDGLIKRENILSDAIAWALMKIINEKKYTQ